MSKRPMSYGASMARLKELVEKLDQAQVDVDELEAVVKESVALISGCRARLRATQGSVDALLANLDDQAAVPAAGASRRALTLVGEGEEPCEEQDPFIQ